jgi:hypothetical protein
VQSLGEVLAGSGERLWQDRANHLVWVKVQGGLAWPHPQTASAHDDMNLYRALSVVIKGSKEKLS